MDDYNFQAVYEKSVLPWIKQGKFSSEYPSLLEELRQTLQTHTQPGDSFDMEIVDRNNLMVVEAGYQSFALGLIYGMSMAPFFRED